MPGLEIIMVQEMDLEQQLQLLGLQMRTEDKPHRQHIVAQVLGLVQEQVRQIVLPSELQSMETVYAKKIRSSKLLYQEFVRLMVQQAIELHSQQLRTLVKGNLRWRQQGRVLREEVLHDFPNYVEAILSQREPTVKKTEVDAEIEQMLLQLYDEQLTFQEGGSHFANMKDKKTVGVRRMKKEDIDSIKALYERYRINHETIIKLQGGDDTRETFLNPFEAEEGPTMQEMVPRSDWLAQKKTKEERRAEQTMEGYVVTSPLDDREILAACIYQKSPLVPKKDKKYMEKIKSFLEGGVSGGVLKFQEQETRNDVEQCLLNEPTCKLFLIVRKESGTADLAHAYAITHMEDVDPNERWLTYAMGRLRLQHQATILPGAGGFGHNAGSVGFLNHWGYTPLWASDEKADAPFTNFVLNPDALKKDQIVMGARPVWYHYETTQRKMEARAAQIETF